MVIKSFKVNDVVISISGPQVGIVGIITSTKPNVKLITYSIKVKPDRKTFKYNNTFEYNKINKFCNEWSSARHWKLLKQG